MARLFTDMTLSQLINALRNVPGSGHPAYLETPDGKKWEPSKIVTSWEVAEVENDKITTIVKLKEVK